MEISQKAINEEKIINAQFQFEKALFEIRLTENERRELQSPFDDLVNLAYKLNN